MVVSAEYTGRSQNKKSEINLSICAMQITTDIMMKQLMVMLTEVANELHEFIGTIWVPHNNHQQHHQMFAQFLLEEKPTNRFLKNKSNWCEGVTIEMSDKNDC